MTAQTNLETAKHPELDDAAKRLFEAAHKFWRIHQSIAGGGAVVWVTDTDGRMVIFTRGEYSDRLMRNIDRLKVDVELVRPFSP